MESAVTLDEALRLVRQLSLIDKVRLMEAIAPQIKQDLLTTHVQPRLSLRGLWQGINIIDADITKLRQDMWSNLPGEDV